MRRVRLLGALLALGLASGCSSVQVESDWNPSIDFARLHSYAWLEEGPLHTGDPRFDNALLDGRIRQATDRTLAAKGYAKAPHDSADFLVAYQVTAEKKVDLVTIYDGYGYGWRGWGGGVARTYATEYQVGTLLLDVLDPKTKLLVWRGSGSDVLRESRTPEERDRLVQEAVQKILAQFPPPARAR